MTKTSGFTIVELLIVVVVISILAAITVVSYNGIQNRAKDAAALNVTKNVEKKVQLYKSLYGTYPTTTQLNAQPETTIDSGVFTVSDAMPTTERHVRYILCSGNNGVQIIYRVFPTGTASVVLGICS